MREIKFRGRNPDTHELVVGSLVCIGGVFAIDPDGIGAEAPSDTKWHASKATIVKPETIEQWTGCVDKHGREVYEGDSVSFRGNHKKTYFGRVTFRNGAFVIVSATERKHFPKAFLLGDIEDEYGSRLSDVEILGEARRC